MTEAEWLTCTAPGQMLRFLRDRLTDRKARLYGCACVRTVWIHLTDARSQDAVELAERYADGQTTRDSMMAARTAAYQAAYGKRTWAPWSAIALLGDSMLSGIR